MKNDQNSNGIPEENNSTDVFPKAPEMPANIVLQESFSLKSSDKGNDSNVKD